MRYRTNVYGNSYNRVSLVNQTLSQGGIYINHHAEEMVWFMRLVAIGSYLILVTGTDHMIII